MSLDISATQKKRVERIERLRSYFGEEKPEIYEERPSDAELDFTNMSDGEVAEYLKRSS